MTENRSQRNNILWVYFRCRGQCVSEKVCGGGRRRMTGNPKREKAESDIFFFCKQRFLFIFFFTLYIVIKTKSGVLNIVQLD